MSHRQLQFAILQYLALLRSQGATAANGLKDPDTLDIAIQCLEDATGLETRNPQHSSQFSTSSRGDLLSIFSAGLNGSSAPSSSSADSSSSSGSSGSGSGSGSGVEQDEKFQQFVELLKQKDFFAGLSEGSPQYQARLDIAKQKFHEKHASSASAASSPPAEVSAADKQAADTAKNEGNALLSKGNYAGAVQKYSDAIRLNPDHAIYYANRAAAHISLKQYESAIEDCQAAIEKDATYAKAHYRLGQAYAAIGNYADAIQPYETALTLTKNDPDMQSTIRENLQLAKSKLAPSNNNSSAAANNASNPFAGGMPNLGGMDLGAMLNNPMMQQMLGNMDIGAMMQNPMIQQMMAGMMGGGGMPDLSNLGGMMQEEVEEEESVSVTQTTTVEEVEDAAPAEPTPAAEPSATPSSNSSSSNPQLSAFLNSPAGASARADPVLAPVIADIQANGVGAAMKYMSDPAVMAKISALLPALQGKK